MVHVVGATLRGRGRAVISFNRFYESYDHNSVVFTHKDQSFSLVVGFRYPPMPYLTGKSYFVY